MSCPCRVSPTQPPPTSMSAWTCPRISSKLVGTLWVLRLSSSQATRTSFTTSWSMARTSRALSSGVLSGGGTHEDSRCFGLGPSAQGIMPCRQTWAYPWVGQTRSWRWSPTSITTTRGWRKGGRTAAVSWSITPSCPGSTSWGRSSSETHGSLWRESPFWPKGPRAPKPGTTSIARSPSSQRRVGQATSPLWAASCTCTAPVSTCAPRSWIGWAGKGTRGSGITTMAVGRYSRA
mmetsp:Transcript_50868/g.142371  ORF Transcript_50868/g.142371 Transcript_50868/m.142371 type:complete len:234 (-) Transcript_50868:405-1106(-)